MIFGSFLDPFFIDFSCFFRNPSRRPFLEVPSAGFHSKVRFWTDFRFSKGPKIDPRSDIFRRKKIKASQRGTSDNSTGHPLSRIGWSVDSWHLFGFQGLTDQRMGRPRLDFGPKNMTFEVPFGIDFSTFRHPRFGIVFSSFLLNFRYP